jgi:hypothetical protein
MRNIKPYNSPINESIMDNYKIDDCIEMLQEAQISLDDALNQIKGVYNMLRSSENCSQVAERMRSYIIGHLEPLISSDHEWMTRSLSIEKVIEELEECKGMSDGEEE